MYLGIKSPQNTFEMINWVFVEEEIKNLLYNRFFIQLCLLRRENDNSQQQKDKLSNLEADLHHLSLRLMAAHSFQS